MKQTETTVWLHRSLAVAVAVVVVVMSVGFGPSVAVASAEEESSPEVSEARSGDEEGSSEAKNVDARVTKAATRALFKARVRHARAVADHAVSMQRVKQMERRATRAERAAEAARRDMGNLVRLTYSSGDSTLNLLAGMVDARTPTDLMDRASSAERVTEHQSVEVQLAEKAQNKAKRLRAEASQLLDEAVAELAEARFDLAQTKKLAKGLDLDTKLLMSGGPVDLATKSKWVYPVPGVEIGSEAGWRMHPILGTMRCHTGADMAVAEGTRIHVVDNGVVLEAGDGGGFGNYTVVYHGGGLTSAYAHQSSILVEKGDLVARGQVIGLVGNTGLSTGAHLHFEARYFGDPYNPHGWLDNKRRLRVPAC